LAIFKFFPRQFRWSTHQKARSALSTSADEAMKIRCTTHYLYSHSQKGFYEKVARYVSIQTNCKEQLSKHQPNPS